MESSRLIYRKLQGSDFEVFNSLYSNPAVMKYAYSDCLNSSEEALEAFKSTLEHQDSRHSCCEYVALLRNSNQAVGIVDYDVLLEHDHGGILEIGYFIKPEYWGQGFGVEMAGALIDEVFGNTKVHKIVASCNSNNGKSEHIMQKLGMTKEGIFRKVRYKNNRWEDEIKYGLLKEEWVLRQKEAGR